MTTQYTSILKLALPVQGELSGTWGDVVNDNITSMVEQAIAGRAVINSWSGNSHTLTTANGTTSESRCAMLEFTDTGAQLSGAGTVVCPALSKIYIAKNAAGQNVTLKTASGTGILVPNGRTMFLFCDETNVVEAVTSTTSLQLGTSTTVTAVLDEDNMASDSATSLATQQSIKAYVDSQVATSDTLAEVLANGNTTGGTDVAFGDNDKAIFGAGSDLQIYHDGTNSYIEDAGTGSLKIKSNGSFIDIQSNSTRINNAANNEIMATFVANGAVTLNYDNASKLATTSTGIDVTGDVDTSGLLKVGTNDTEYANNYVRFKPTGAAYIDHSTVGQAINFRLSNASSLDKTAMTLTSAGNVGIAGQTSPTYKLDGGFADQTWGWYLNSSYNAGFTYNTTERSLLISTKSAENIDHIKFATGGAATERFRISADGSLSTPTAGTSNVRFGVNAGNSIASGGNYNVVVGDEAGTAITTGDNNVAVGYKSLAANITGGNNVAMGFEALLSDTVGLNSVAIGLRALKSQNFTSATNVYNTAVGYNAGAAVSTGVQNTLIGGLAGDA